MGAFEELVLDLSDEHMFRPTTTMKISAITPPIEEPGGGVSDDLPV
jgi:hypothetical protein